LFGRVDIILLSVLSRKTFITVTNVVYSGVIEASDDVVAPHFRQITMPAPHHSISMGQMLFAKALKASLMG